MAFIFKGNLNGFLCDECFNNLSEVSVKLYRPQSLDNIAIQAVLAAKDTFKSVTADEVLAKQNALFAETVTDEAGNFTFELSENNYNGEAFDIDFECGTVPIKIPIPKREPRQFHITTLQPIWRGTDNVKTFSWSYSLPSQAWCYILSLYDVWSICGRVIDCKTQRPVPKVEVHAFDSDLFQDDKMGSALTDKDGHFLIQFTGDVFRPTIIPGFNIEFPSGPDVYFHITVPGVTPTVYLLKEPSNAANTIAGRKNIKNCLCVELCANLDDIPHDGNIVPPSFRAVGNYSIATDFDSNGFTNVGKYAFTSSVELIGDLPNGGNSNFVEFRFRVINMNTSVEIPWATLKNAFPAFQIGHLKKYNSALPISYPTYPYEDVPLTLDPITAADANGWMVAPHQNDLSDGGAGLFIPNSILSVLDTTKFVTHFFDLTLPTIHVAGTAIDAGDKFAGPDHVFRIIFEARDAGTIPVTTSNMLSKMVVWNGQPTNAFRQNRHPSWSGNQPHLLGVCMLDINELMGMGNGCKDISTSVRILSSVYHPYLESASMSMEGPNGTINIPMPAPSVSGEIVMDYVHTFAVTDPACAYILDLSCGYRLTNGSAAGGGYYFNTDRMAFCKS